MRSVATVRLVALALRATLLPAVLSALACSSALAADFAAYTIRDGDTLYDVALRLLGRASLWPELARVNRIADPHLLSPGTSLRVPVERLPWTPVIARVTAVVGRAVLRVPGSDDRVLSPGDSLRENDELRVASGGLVTLNLGDTGDAVRLDGDTVLRLTELRTLLTLNGHRTRLDLRDGRVESTVSAQQPAGRFEVRTPLAVAGVRGTRFGVAMLPGGETAADVIEGSVALSGLGQTDGGVVGAGRAGILAQGGVVAIRDLLARPDLSSIPPLHERPTLTIDVPPIDGAVAYRVEIASDAAMTQTMGSLPRTSMPARFAGLADGDYYVAVRAIDPTGIPGREAVRPLRLRARPEPPLLQTPGPNQRVRISEAALTCAGNLAARAYQFQISRSALFDDAVVTPPEQPACRYELRELKDEGEYYWRVATVDAGPTGAVRRGPYGDPGRFVAVKGPYAPQAEVDADDPSVVHWSAEPGWRFEVQLAPDAAFDQQVQTFEVSQPRVHLPLSPCKRYFVRLQAVDANGFRSGFSSPREVKVPAAVCTGQGDAMTSPDGSAVRTTPR